ncbi:MAG: signal peptidase I [Negativicutes bacterium]|nr:signal peptidase I [Negativicutes bacterium]
MKTRTALKLPGWKIVLRNLFLVFLSLIILFNLYVISAQFFQKNELPKIFGYAQVVVVSGSMLPEIQVGDLLIIHQQAEYAVNDVITYRSGASLVTHRLLSVQGDQLVTKGDANNVADPAIALSQVEGKVVLRLSGLGKLIYFLKTKQGIYLTALLAILLFAVPYAADAIREYKNKPKQ